MRSPAKGLDLDVTKTKLIRLSPTKEQKKQFKHWTDGSRRIFNLTIDYIRSCVGFIPHWMDIKKDMKSFVPYFFDDIPYQVKAIAVKEAHAAFFAAKGRPKFRALKDPEQSCFIPKSAIKETGIYVRLTGKGLRYHEALPEFFMDSRLIWRFEKWWLAVPHKEKLSIAKNQGRTVAIDPGVRSFASFYSNTLAGRIADGDFGRIQRLCFHLDRLLSKRDKSKNKQRKRVLSKAAKRMRAKIKHLIKELHHKTAKFLTDNFDVILLPTFETMNMASKAGRKIGKKSVRSMLTFSHYMFKTFLKWKAHCTGKMVIDCNEAFTSKTHPETGRLVNIGSKKQIPLQDGSIADRDIIGARNILLRALVDTPMGCKFRAVSNR
ncbi:MAG: transposase [Thermodesulfobacteriota bacterium]|nr:transposase [Thermodesulfobacteriota bacterium]